MTLTDSWRRPVIKVGTSTLTGGSPRLSLARLADLVEQVAGLHAAGLQPIIVSSGAVAVGRQRLEFPAARRDLSLKQMLAAVGQSRLMHLYDQAFEFHGITCAQVLLTREDLAERQRYLNARNTLVGLCQRGVVPIVNENDAVASDEIKVGDNDTLSALVANVVDADLLVLVTDIAGLYTADPADPSAELVREVEVITPETESYAGSSRSSLGTGGMATKIAAARLATASGTEVRIVDGRERDAVRRALDEDHPPGTRFLPRANRVEGRKRWILSGLGPGAVIVDRGAAEALLHRGASLLPAGVTGVEGRFNRGDTVEILAADGDKIGAGIANYGAEDARAITGSRSSEIERILGYSYGGHVVHRDDLVAFAAKVARVV